MIIKLEALIKGTPLEQRLDFCKACYLQGLCTEEEYRKERVKIAEEVKKEIKNNYKNLIKGEMI